MSHGRRRILHFNVTTSPSAQWTAQQLLEAFPYEAAPRFLLHDRDSIFGNSFHTIWPRDNHEYVHSLVTSLVGISPALFDEGIAVAHHGASLSGSFEGDPLWNGGSAHARVRSLRATMQLPALNAIIENEAFEREDPNVTYPVAGSFVRYLIDQAGTTPLLTFIARCPRDASASQVRAHFRDAFGDDLDAWWARWLAWL